MAQFINLNNTHIINISDIQSVVFKEKAIGTLYGKCKLSKRYTQKTGRKIIDYDNRVTLPGNYQIIEIELKTGHLISINDFDLKDLKEYIISEIENITSFECAEINYIKPDSNVTIDGELNVKNTINYTGDCPIHLTLDSSSSRLNVKIIE